MKERSLEECKRGVVDIQRELAAIRKGGEEVEEVERQLKQAVRLSHDNHMTCPPSSGEGSHRVS